MATESVKCSCVWLLLWLCVLLSQTTNTRASMNDDILLPYTQGHGPSHSHRYVRDCQPIIHGNTTYESWPSSNRSGQPVAETKWFVSDIPKSSRVVYGHMTVVNDPLRTVSVLEPGGPGGCKMGLMTKVQETAEAAGCLYAQNAGFFNTSTGQCLGNVVSNGRVVQDSGGLQNAQFGIRKDGSLVFGYLSQDDVLDQSNPFVQLVSGVVWLLRNGEIYIRESMEAECSKTQETGAFHSFVDVVSARTAVGHDAEGRLILFHFEGQTSVRGLNLWEMANFLRERGVINAINLDGGGSATYINNGVLASYPSDHCVSDNMWRCGRNVSTILCIHKRRCHPANCSEHGDCVDGHCQCHDGWRGAACDSLVCQPSACGPHGICTANGCVCVAGWRGKNCSQECLAGFYGDGCNQSCSCVNGGSCDPVHGRCTCPPGFHGNSCDQVCPLGFYGLSCAQECHCEDLCPCDPQTGSCNTTLPEHTNYTLHAESRCRNSSVFVAVCPNRGAPCQLIWEDWKCYSPASGHCLARKMFTFWRQEEDAHRERPYLTERTWLIITFTLAAFLSASLLVHLVQACRVVSVASRFPKRRDYSYIPLSNINGVASCATDDTGGAEKEDFQLEDSDSQDEIWSSSHSGQS